MIIMKTLFCTVYLQKIGRNSDTSLPSFLMFDLFRELVRVTTKIYVHEVKFTKSHYTIASNGEAYNLV